MQGRNYALLLSLFLVTACSGESGIRKADCYDCTTENQSWKKFAWQDLEGTWRGSIETVSNELKAKKKDTKQLPAEIRFVAGDKFLATQKVTNCGSFPATAVVLNGSLWQENDKTPPKTQSYEVFGQVGSDVSYGRVSFTKLNGENVCSYERIGALVGMNRLALPAVHFSQRLTPNGRVLASGTSTNEFEVNLEFLNFDANNAKAQVFPKGSRKPASVSVQDNPPLMFRVFKIVNAVHSAYDQGSWQSSQEHIYRLWRAE